MRLSPPALASAALRALEAAARLCRRLVADMMVARYGRVVLFGSMAGRAGVAGGTLYSMHKAGLEGLARGLSVDYARRGVTARRASRSRSASRT